MWVQMEGKKITLFIPKIKLCQDKKKKRRERNVMQISWKQTFYVPLLRDWTKQYKVYYTEQKQRWYIEKLTAPFYLALWKIIQRRKVPMGESEKNLQKKVLPPP